MTPLDQALPDSLRREIRAVGGDPKEAFLQLDRGVVNLFLDKATLSSSLGWKCSEVVIGAGLHAAIFAANRGRNTIPCIGDSMGGIFDVARRPVFYLNSRNRPEQDYRVPGSSGPLNSIIGGILQPSDLSMLEYQDQSDFALAIRTNLACFTSVLPGRVERVFRGDPDREDRRYVITHESPPASSSKSYASRIIVASGLGEPRLPCKVQGRKERVMTFPEFLKRMGDPKNLFPLKGFERVAIIGSGDSGKVVAEYLLGLGPQPGLSTAGQNFVKEITWIGQKNRTKEDWEECERSRYNGLGRSFPRRGKLNYYYRIKPVQGRAERVLGGTKTVRVDWGGVDPGSARFDYVVLCTGFENRIDDVFEEFDQGTEEVRIDGTPVARKYVGEEIYIVGPAAELELTDEEKFRFPVEVPENIASAFRYSERTAKFAKNLGSLIFDFSFTINL